MSEFYSRTESSLATAWARVFRQMIKKPDRRLSPFMVSIAAGSDGNPIENQELRNALDACLDESGQQSIEVVAKTIFPAAIWKRVKGDRKKLYDYYKEYLPDYVAMAPTKNCHGLYFARLIGFGINPKTGIVEDHLSTTTLREDGNQLEFIIKSCKPGAIPTELQAAIYDPVRDQVPKRYTFPCLQHITFVRDKENNTLSLNAFYALQSFFVKAYGNWLGLLRLGEFVASQTGLRFERLNCFAGIQQTRNGSRPKPGKLLNRLKEISESCLQEEPAEANAAS